MAGFRRKVKIVMKSEKRHDLKTNELADWIMNLPQWLQDNQKTIIYVIIVIAVLIVGWFWFSHKKSATLSQSTAFTDSLFQLPERKYRVLSAYIQGQDISSGLLDYADQLENAGRDTTNKPMAALALIESANTIRTELHYRRTSPDKQQLTTQINKAKEAYQNAISLLTAPNDSNSILYPSLTASAKFGLGLCQEELGNFKEAQKIYDEINKTKELQSTAPAAQAKLRLKSMTDYQKQVVFAPAPKMELITPPNLLTEPNSVQQPTAQTLVPVTAAAANTPDMNQ
jgi:tetratricopeptide (TPR) repeat protein